METLLDYRQGANHVTEQLQTTAKLHVISYAYDAVSDKASVEMLSKVVSPQDGKIMSAIPKADEDIGGITLLGFNAGSIHAPAKEGIRVGDADLGLGHGWFSGHPYEVVQGGLNRLERALKDLEGGYESAKKYVLRLAETPGVSKD
ncbi:unnamed protein product [Penicillium manginii]